MKIKILAFVLAFILHYSISNSQNTDSLLNLTKSNDELVRFKAWVELSYGDSDDSLIFYYSGQAIKEAKEMNVDSLLGQAYRHQGFLHYYRNSYRLAVEEYENALSYFKKADNKKAISNTYYFLALAYKYWGYYSKAIKYAQEGLDYSEKNNLSDHYKQFWLVTAYIYLAWGHFDESEIYCNKIINLTKKDDDQGILAYAKLGKGNIFLERGQNDSAFVNINKAFDIFSNQEDTYGMALCYRDFGKYNLKLENNDKALGYFESALKIFEELRSKRGKSEVLILIGNYYMGEQNYSKAVDYYREGQALAVSMELPEDVYKNYKYLSAAFEKAGDLKNALRHYKLYSEMRDSVFTLEKFEQFSEYQIKYETEKKEKLLAVQQTQIEKNKARQRILYVFLLAGALIILAFLYAYIQKRRDNKKILFQKDEISKKNEELEVQKAEIEKSHRQTTNSITYARRIQEAILPKTDVLTTLSIEHFILAKPRDIVSGDFYWFHQAADKLYFCVADCTGHGVPGALMSMLGISLLNEITKTEQSLNSAQILNKLRNDVKLSLQQTGVEGEQQDGMDISFCIIDLKTRILNFSGAYHPLLIIGLNSENGESVLNEISSDRQPVGIYMKELPFTDHLIKLNKGDMLYLFSDGFHSQFGGEKNETLKMKRFKDVLKENSKLPAFKQKSDLNTKFENWKGSNEQTDDVLVLGIRV